MFTHTTQEDDSVPQSQASNKTRALRFRASKLATSRNTTAVSGDKTGVLRPQSSSNLL